ncbi:non-specific lipid transfer protein GPI-anchored 11-like [Oryza glaberrima]|uniref:Bifunctional inhibitor/plant lipid transfer protein/seed storage helical domain-containing protein n=2 Tax=Oryza TaxID=4527 RepID=A0A0D3FEW3_9ORYZ|nr:non-specific lipid transfer protein GPI-anchored 11-like [Oryza glaberrima]
MAGAGRTRSTAMAAWSYSSLLLQLLLLSMVAVLDGAATTGGGGAGVPAPAADCTDALLSLAGCLSYVQEGSTVAKPDAPCCSGLKGVVKKEVACLCQAFQGSQNFGVTLNMTKALQLPAACKVKTPPFSKCHLSIPGVTGGAPAPAPFSGAPFFGGSSPSASPAGTGSDSAAATVRAPAPSPSAAVRPKETKAALFSAAVIAAATLLAHRA